MTDFPRPAAPRFTAEDAARAYEEWGANCGPGALAAICGLTLAEARAHLRGFDQKRYTNPSMMWAALAALGKPWRRVPWPLTWPEYGLARIQWHGPWMAPGVPPKVAYWHTHWVGARSAPGDIGIFDINAIGNGTGWCSLKDWGETLVPWLLSECEPKADGLWSITHAVEVRP
jgi:hypothetical protein